jgi:GT2 family glycosyltransferase
LNDVDFCLKLEQHGWLNLYRPGPPIFHLESESRGLDEDGAKRARRYAEMQVFIEKWPHDWQIDPWRSAALSAAGEAGSIR